MHPDDTGNGAASVVARRPAAALRPSAGRTPRDPALDGLRAVAALFILVTHVSFQTGYVFDGRFGAVTARLEVGVAVFFVLSSYLLFRPFASWLLQDGPRPSVRRYLRNRAVRILPAYWATVVLVAVLVSPVGLKTAEDWVWQLLLLQNYEVNRLVLGATQMWSLSTEVAFYLVMPVLAWGAAQLLRSAPPGTRRRRLFLMLGGLAVVSLLWPASYLVGPLDGFVAPLWLPQFLGWFAAGMALATLSVSGRGGRAAVLLREAAAAPWACWAAAAAVLWLASTPLAGPRDLVERTYLEEVSRLVTYGLFAVLVLLPLIARAESGPRRLLTTPLAGYLGRISYPIFLVQLVALDLAYQWLPVEQFDGGTLVVLITTLAVTLGLAELLHRLVEQPVLQRLRRR